MSVSERGSPSLRVPTFYPGRGNAPAKQRSLRKRRLDQLDELLIGLKEKHT